MILAEHIKDYKDFGYRGLLGLQIDDVKPDNFDTRIRDISSYEDHYRVFRASIADMKVFILCRDNIVVSIMCAKKKGAAHRVESVIAVPKTGVHMFYAHLILKHNMILTTDIQSRGGWRVWKKLSKIPNINVHLFDRGKETAETIKFDDIENTHVRGWEYIRMKRERVRRSDRESKKADLQELRKELRNILVAHKM